MPFDASKLWWPPLDRLYSQLGSTSEPREGSAEALQASLKVYQEWLAGGVLRFKTPNDKSRKAIETETVLSVREKKLLVEPALQSAALDVSRYLDLDEVQAYILLKRWVGPGNALPPAGLTAAQCADLADLYARERMCLLKATETLLWLGEEIGSGPFPDAVEGALAQLLEDGLEDATFQALQANLQRGPSPAAGTATGIAASAGALVPVAAGAAAAPGYSSLFGFGGSGGGRWGSWAGAAAGGGVSEEQRAAERCSLLNILNLIYYHPRRQCTPDRFLALARLFHKHLFSVPLPRQQEQGAGGSDEEPAPARLALKLATVLLLEMLDVDKALSAVADSTPLTEANYAFAAPATRKQVNDELSSWWRTAGTAHSPVLLAWAAVLCLVAKSGSEEGGTRVGPEEYGGHAQRAHELDALGALSQLSGHSGLAPNASEMASNILLSVLSAVVCAFDLSPLSMPLPLSDRVVATLCNLYQGQPALCDSFWAEERITEEPLRHFVADVRGLFPAFSPLLYRLLCALSATSDSAVAANACLAALQGLVCLHALDREQGLLQDANDDGRVYTEEQVALPGSKALTLPRGILGEVLPLPGGLSVRSMPLLLLGAAAATPGLPDCSGGGEGGDGDEDGPEGLALVRWSLPLAEGTGQWVLLCRAFEAVASLQQAMEAPALAPAATAALCELSCALRLLAAICSHDPPTALELLHVEVPAGEGRVGEGGGPDMLTLACHAVTVLCRMANPSVEAIGDGFTIMAALAQSIPGRVGSELAAVLKLTGGLLSEAARAQDVPALGLLLHAEGAAGRYPATLALLSLATALVGSGDGRQELQVLVGFVLRRLLGEHHTWRYASRAERWRLATAALRFVRHALLSEGVREAGEGVLRYDVDVAACLLPALPPPAKALERLGLEARPESEIVAAEACALEWLRLLPVMLPAQQAQPEPGGATAGEAPGLLGAGAFFRDSPDGAGAPCAAAVLLSYLTYEFFGVKERALALKAATSLAAAAAQAAPGLTFASLLPLAPGEAALSPETRAAFTSALEPQRALAHPELACGACALLSCAATSHASLADALLFPCNLEKADKENQDANAKGQGGALISKEGKGRSPTEAAGSCLDSAWRLLQHAEQLGKEQPAVLAALLRLLSTLWQVGATAYRPVAILRRQPKLWPLLASHLMSAATSGPSNALVPDTGSSGDNSNGSAGGGNDSPGLAAAWGDKSSTVWAVAAEAYALQILAAELFMAAASFQPKEALCKELRDLLAREGAGLAGLLQRYCAPLPTARLLAALRDAAAAAGLELVGEALADEQVWPSLVAAPSVLATLHSAAAPLLSQFGAREAATSALLGHAEDLIRHNPSQPAVVEVGEALLALAEVPHRLVEGRAFGDAYAFDSQLCLHRLGSVLGQQSAFAQALPAWLGAASLAASLEDARLAAATALKALLSGLHRYSSRMEPGSSLLPVPTPSQLEGGTQALASALDDITHSAQQAIAQAAGQLDDGDMCDGPAGLAVHSGTLDLQSVHIMGAAEGAYGLLLLLRRWAAEAGSDRRAELTTQLLLVTSRWVAALADVLAAAQAEAGSRASHGGGHHERPRGALHSLTTSLLAGALLAVEALPALEGPALEQSQVVQSLQSAAVQGLPVLLGACQRHREHLAEAAALATALLDRCIPSPYRLPLMKANLHLGSLLGDMLKDLIARGLGQQQRKLQQQLQQPPRDWERQQQAKQEQQGLLPAGEAEGAAAGKEEASVLLLALQAAQEPGGAQLLVQQGVVGHTLLLCKWLLAPEGGNLMGEVPAPAPGRGQPVDYSNAYRQDGSPNPAHQLWCSALSLMGLLLAALPGYEAVEGAALELAVAGEGRLLLAVDPPAGSRLQPVTLAMLQETRYALFFLTALARLSGRWRALLPDSLPALRQASAGLLEFISHTHEAVHAAAVSLEERALAKGTSPPRDAPQLSAGWPHVFCHGGSSVCPALALQLAERLYGCAQLALSFQLAVAPEVGEEESQLLGSEWPTPAVLTALQEQCLAVVQAAPREQPPPASRQLYRAVGQVLALSAQLQAAMVLQVPHQQSSRVNRALTQLQQLLEQA